MGYCVNYFFILHYEVNLSMCSVGTNESKIYLPRYQRKLLHVTDESVFIKN